MDYDNFLWSCKFAAERHISKIPKESGVITKIEGMSTPYVRHLMNNINQWGKNYLEVGSHKGSTFVSSLYGHSKNGWSIDNFSEFCDESYAPGLGGTHEQELLKNIDSYLTCPTKFFNCDSFSFDLSNIDAPVDVYMYDGDHDQDKQKKALEYFYPALNDIFVLIVDDWNSQSVRDGTYEGIRDAGLCILSEMPIRTYQEGQREWWSGIYVAFLAKECPPDRFLQTSPSSGACNFAHPIQKSRPRDNVLRFSQPENNKTEAEIREILTIYFPKLSAAEIDVEIQEGYKLLEQQKTRGTF